MNSIRQRIPLLSRLLFSRPDIKEIDIFAARQWFFDAFYSAMLIISAFMPGKHCKTGEGRRSRKTIGPRRKHDNLEESVPDEVETSVVVEVNFCYL